jgi:hypothetical protein
MYVHRGGEASGSPPDFRGPGLAAWGHAGGGWRELVRGAFIWYAGSGVERTAGEGAEGGEGYHWGERRPKFPRSLAR